jgi:nitronate monooxygenase
MLEAGPAAVSSIMGLFPPDYVAKLRRDGIAWLATATTVDEARLAEAAGADAIIAQGAEAGGHRGSFRIEDAEVRMVGLFALLPAVADAVKIPVIAAGGIADARGAAAALLLGASAVMIGTGFLRCPEAQLPQAWADALARTPPEQTALTRAFSGRAGRSLITDYVQAAAAPDAPTPAPYPVQRALTARMRSAALKAGDVQRMQAWAGQSAALARAMPAGALLAEIWAGAQRLLG